MEDTFEFEGFTIKRLFVGKEENYEICDCQGYYCRLVPGYLGFEVSKHDQSVGNLPDQSVIAKLSDYIVRKYA